jgi:hypothetical protein
MDMSGDIIIAKSKERRGLTHYKLIWEIPGDTIHIKGNCTPTLTGDTCPTAALQPGKEP